MLTTVSGPIEGSINTSIIISATQTWNNTMIRCHAEAGGSDCFSNEASLFVYSSLSKFLFPPYFLSLSLSLSGSPSLPPMHSLLSIKILPLYTHTCTGPFPPTDLRITTINGSTAIVTWNHSILWKGYQFDGFDIVVSNHSNTVLSVNMLDSDTHEYILTEFSQPSCSKLNFSIAATSSLHGDSDYTIVNKKFGSGT